jgi:transcriptional regulator with XRE-family HTH domain
MKGGAPGSFGAQLKMLREAAGFTQEELATIAGLSVHAVSALELARAIASNAALRSIVRRDSGESYEECLTSSPKPIVKRESHEFV